MGALTTLKHKALSGAQTVADVAGLFISVSGATVATVFGKAVLGIFLGAVAIGFLLRLKSRRRHPESSRALPLPTWVRPLVAVLSLVELAALVEATNLPVRFNQVGFAYGHWYLLALAFGALYLLQVGVAQRIANKGQRPSAA